MAGTTPQEAAAEKLYDKVTTQSAPFGFETMVSGLKDVFGSYRDLINRETAQKIANQQQGAAESLASRGITGGSILTDTQSKIGSELNRSKTNALSNLSAQQSSAIGDLQKYFNQRQLDLFRLEGESLKGLDNTNWLDDVMALAKDAASIYASIKGSPIKGGGN